MSEKTFLINMDEMCDLSYMNICQRYQKDCSGEICYRPNWCLLKELREAKSWDVDNRFVWVEK